MKNFVNITLTTLDGKVTHQLLTDCSQVVRNIVQDSSLTSWLYAWWNRGRNDHWDNDDVGQQMLDKAGNTPVVIVTRLFYAQGLAQKTWTEALTKMILSFPQVLEAAYAPSEPKVPAYQFPAPTPLQQPLDTAEAQTEERRAAPSPKRSSRR